MNKRYIDFVPAAKGPVKRPMSKPVAKKPAVKRPTVAKPAAKPVAKPKKPAVKLETPLEEMFGEREQPAGVSTGLKSAKYGVIEDYQPRFVKADVKKRPLGAKKPASVATKAVKPAAKIAAKAQPPRAKFVNLKEVEKRPLSKNVYAKKAPVTPKKPAVEKPEKPVVIITKPEKDSKAGMIIAVILTIILGAAAGTVAFLLLPK